ncbi:MAG: O-antigen ligase family protein [Candidatus Moraniibacteriota bacterium]
MKKIIKLENLIYFSILALPSYLWKVSFFGLPSNLLEVLIGVCLVWWLLLRAKKNSWLDFFGKYKAFFLPVGLIFLGFILSMCINKSYVVSAGSIKAWFVLPILFSFVAISAIKKERRAALFGAYYASASFVAIISLAYFISGRLTYDGRLAGIFNSPNYLAMYLAPAIFVGYFLLFPETKIKRWQKGILFLLSLLIFAVYLTYSYATWLALAVAFALVFVIEKKAIFRKAFAVFLIIGTLIFLQLGKDKFSNLISFDARSSLTSREMIWRSAEKMIREDWLWGIGVGNFQTKYLEYQKYFSPYLEWAVPHPHNLYLAFWLYAGLIGLVSFFWLIILWFRAIFAQQKNPNLKLMGLGIMLYILLHGLFDTTYFKNDLAVIFWLLFTLL